MGKTIAQKVFETHLVDKPFEGTYVLKLDRGFLPRNYNSNCNK